MRAHIGPDFLRAFGRGVGVGALVLALAALGLQLGSGAILRHEEAKLAQQVVPVHRPGDAAAERQAAAQATPLTAPPPETPARPDTVVETKKPDIPNDAPLAPAPVAGLYEEADGSRLPMIGQDGATPFRAYRRPFDIYAGDQPVIALGVTGLGLSASAFAEALKNLPPEVSFVLSPYGSDLDSLTQQARAKGHETWLVLPMETAEYPKVDPGPQALLVSAPEKDNLRRLGWIMSRTTGYAGLVSSAPETTVMKSPATVRLVLGALFQRGLGFIDSAPQPGAVPQTIAIGMKAPYGNIDLMIDAQPDKDHIDAALRQLEQIAKTQGVASGMIHPLPISYERLAAWSRTLADKGIRLAPLSAAATQ